MTRLNGTATVTQGAAHEAVMPVTEPPQPRAYTCGVAVRRPRKLSYVTAEPKKMIPMLLMQNAETINRLLEQGEFILKTYHAEYEKDPAGHKTEFLRGNLVGWRETLHTLYHDGAEEIVKSVVAKTRLDVPDSRSRSCLLHSSAPREFQRAER